MKILWFIIALAGGLMAQPTIPPGTGSPPPITVIPSMTPYVVRGSSTPPTLLGCAYWTNGKLYSTGLACGGAVNWGSIGGTLASQTDLNSALSGKVSPDDVRTLTNKILTLPGLTAYTIATLPAATTVGVVAVVTDALVAGQCGVGDGGGSAISLCRANGTIWQSLGSSSTSLTFSSGLQRLTDDVSVDPTTHPVTLFDTVDATGNCDAGTRWVRTSSGDTWDCTTTNTWTKVSKLGHAHAAADTTSGTFDAARIPTLDAVKIGTGTLAIARLGSGTADGTKFLRDDSVWAVPPGTGGVGSLTQKTFSGTIDFPSIPDGSCSTGTFAASGLADGSGLTLVTELASGLASTAWVDATNTVGVQVCNLSGAAVDLASATYIVAAAGVEVIRQAAAPSTCTAGTGLWQDTDDAGRLYRCSATNTWTEVAGSGGGTLAVGSGGTGQTSATEDGTLVANGSVFEIKVLPSCSDATTSKLLYNSTTNVFSCGADQTTVGGSGITSLGGLTGSTQTFGNDTNVTMVSSGTAHTLTWSGTLAKNRQYSTTVYNDAANTWSTGAQDFGSATSLKVPTGAGAAPTANGLLAYDSTANAYKFGVNGAAKTVAMTDSNITGTAAGLSSTLAIASGGTGAATTSQNYLFAGPTSGSGAPSWRALVAGDVPTLNQNTSGTAAGLTAQYIDWNASSGGNSIANKPALAYLPLAGGTLTGALQLDNLGLYGEASDTNPTCTGSEYRIYADLSENKWKKCMNGSLTDLDTTGVTPDFSTLSGGTNTAAAMVVGTGASLVSSGSGTIRSTETVVVDSTDATSFPLMVDSATGNLAAKTDAGLTYDASTGILSAAGGFSSGAGTVAGEVLLNELTANGTSYISWLSPDEITNTLRLRFPNADPTAGQVMTFGAPSSNISTIAYQSVATANTASAIVARDGSGNFTASTITAALTGNASTATALAANGANCTGELALGVSAAGVCEGTATPTLGTAGSVVGSVALANATSGTVTLQPATGALGSSVLTLPASTGTVAITSGNVATATALAANGANCSAGSYPLGVNASGAAEDCTAAGTGTVTASGTPLIHQIPIWSTATNLIGLTVGTTDHPLIGATGADPAWSKWILTAPTTATTLTSGADNATYTFPAATGTLVSRTSTDTLTNKTLTAATIGASYLSMTETAGGSGWTAKLLVKQDTGAITFSNAATSATGIGGIAIATVTGGGTGQVAIRGETLCVADGTVTNGRLLGVGTTTAGRCKDLGQTDSTLVNQKLQIIGRAQSGGSVGDDITVEFYGPGVYGNAIAAADVPATLSSGTAITNAALTTPSIGAATGTSLLATGIISGMAPIAINTGSDPCPTGTHCTFGTTYKSGYVFNQQTAATRVYIDLPTAAAGLQWCIKNSVVSGTGAAVTGIITVKAQSGDYINNDGTIGSSGGVLSSAGAAGDGACFVASAANHWEAFIGKGTWAP